jgi:hypothetical protein
MSANKSPRLPDPAIEPIPDRDSAPYWQALAEGTFQLQRCTDCATFRWPPRAICNRCRSFDHRWESPSATGRILSWTRTEQVFAEALRAAVPYYVVQVALDVQPDILMIGGWLPERPPESGEAVEIELVRPDPATSTRLPFWKPTAAD